MIRRHVYWSAAGLTGALGLAHLALAWPLYQRMTLDGLWFVGSGLAIIMAATVNVVALRTGSGEARWLVAGVNATMAGFFCLAWSLLKEPQVLVGLALFVVMSGSALTMRGSAAHSRSQSRV